MIDKLNSELGLPDGFCWMLLKEKDWSFVIKLHAVFEAAVTHLLAIELDRPELEAFVASLNMGGQFGKLALAQKLDALGKDHIRYITAVGTMRNACVHDVRNVEFDIKKYVKALAPQQYRELSESVQSTFLMPGNETHRELIKGLVGRQPKTAPHPFTT